MASKYQILADHLEQQRSDTIKFAFEELRKILGFSLPKSAEKHRAWWANDDTHNHAQNGWLKAGWKVRTVDLFEKEVIFKKSLAIANRNEVHRNQKIPINRAYSFEEYARKILSSYYGQELRRREVSKGNTTKIFDFGSKDLSIIGDAKFYSYGKSIPSAKLSTISEYVWLLEKLGTKKKFIIFGNDRRVPIKWLDRYKDLVNGVYFFFLKSYGELEVLFSNKE
ncbi:MAG: hypothetical protein ACE5OZ_01315 [Candidatus Heimdallarchaeota archaeon]